jgi:hypothetical protein
MPVPKRKRTPRTKKTEETTVEVETEVTTTEPVEAEPVEEPEVSTEDKDAIIAELQARIKTEEEQAKKIAELRAQLAEAEKQPASKEQREFSLKPDEGEKYAYFAIVFHPKRTDSDDEFITIGVNGKFLTWRRNVPTVIRSDYMEVANNAFVPKFKQLPGEERKEIGGLKPYTFTIERRIDRSEYERLKAEGDKALKADLEQRGISA